MTTDLIKWKSKPKTVTIAKKMIEAFLKDTGRQVMTQFPKNLFYEINSKAMYQNMTDVGVDTIMAGWRPDDITWLQSFSDLKLMLQIIECKHLQKHSPHPPSDPE